MSKLLTEQELKQKIGEICDKHGYKDWIGDVLVEFGDLIQSQKKAHADMVIGEDDSLEGQTDPEIYFGDKSRNWLRSEQRERNNL